MLKSLNKQACMGLVPLPRQLYLCSSRPLVVNNFRVDGVATIRHSWLLLISPPPLPQEHMMALAERERSCSSPTS